MAAPLADAALPPLADAPENTAEIDESSPFPNPWNQAGVY
jgi:hypothetical protein